MPIRWRHLDDPIKAARPRDNALVEPFGIVGARQIHRPIHLLITVEPLQQITVAVAGDDRVDVLKKTKNGTVGFHPAKAFEATAENQRIIAEKGEMASLDDLGDDLVNQRGFAAALFAVEQITAPVQEAVFAEALAQRPETTDLLQNLGRQAIAKLQQVIDLEFLGLENRIAVLIHDAVVSPRRQLPNGRAAHPILAVVQNHPLGNRPFVVVHTFVVVHRPFFLKRGGWG